MSAKISANSKEGKREQGRPCKGGQGSWAGSAPLHGLIAAVRSRCLRIPWASLPRRGRLMVRFIALKAVFVGGSEAPRYLGVISARYLVNESFIDCRFLELIESRDVTWE